MAITEKIKVEATRAFTYGTRRMVAGDVLTVMPMEARTLNAVGKTRPFATKKAKAKDEDESKSERKHEPKKTSIKRKSEEAGENGN